MATRFPSCVSLVNVFCAIKATIQIAETLRARWFDALAWAPMSLEVSIQYRHFRWRVADTRSARRRPEPGRFLLCVKSFFG